MNAQDSLKLARRFIELPLPKRRPVIEREDFSELPAVEGEARVLEQAQQQATQP